MPRGHSQRELERLTRQAQVFEPFTRQLLQLAGITSGMRVLGMFRAAGLPEPSLRMDTLIGGGPGCIGYQLIAEVVETLLPEIEKRQIATAAEVEIFNSCPPNVRQSGDHERRNSFSRIDRRLVQEECATCLNPWGYKCGEGF